MEDDEDTELDPPSAKVLHSANIMINSFTKFDRITYKADARLLIGSDDVANRHTGAPMRGFDVGSSLCNYVLK
uniref:PEROXIDASE_4 domain-containing protein n=1 Tax=Strongyloides venezuelensis TaxID=75913 RepID=A0A0K0FPL9_STRVS